MRLSSAGIRAAGIAAAALFMMVSPAAAHHKPGHQDNGKGNDPPPMASTPELGSLLLFGTGLAGAGGYALTRWRSRRRSE
jgi:hypothetical protein